MNRIPKPFDRLRPATASQIVTLHRRGFSQRSIASQADVSQATVSRVVAQHLNAIAAPLSDRAQSLELAPRLWEVDDGTSAIALYRTEKAKRDERLRRNPALASAHRAFQERLERDKLAGRGGRPKNVKPVGSLTVGKPGKPQISCQRVPAADALLNALPVWRGNE